MKPTPAGIAATIERVNVRNYIDPVGWEGPPLWDCDLIEMASGQFCGEGQGRTPEEAMSLAWIHFHAPDALILGVKPSEVPLEIPNDFKFDVVPRMRPYRPYHERDRCSQNPK